MKTESLSVVVLSKNANCGMSIYGDNVKVVSVINGIKRDYDSSIAHNFISELRSGLFDIRSIVGELNKVFGIEIDVKNEFCSFRYDSDDVHSQLLILRGIRRYELIHK